MPLSTKSLREAARASYVKALGNEALWRHVMNAGPTREYRKARISLNDEAARVLADVNKNGAAQSTVEALTGDASLLSVLQAEAARLEAEKAGELEDRMARLKSADKIAEGYNKMFVLTLLDPDRPVIDPNGLLAKVALHEQMKGIADGYYGMKTRVTDINIWRNLPSDHEAVSSQLWHRDLPEDHVILKMFIYLEDVTEGAGPFSYVLGTHGKGDRNWRPAKMHHDGHNVRANEGDMEADVSPDRLATFVVPAGTVLFADTFGWHKGGGAKTAPRLAVQVLYASKAALPDRMLAAPAGLALSDAPWELAYEHASHKKVPAGLS